MPNWGWWVTAVLLVVFWNLNSVSIGGWWRTVLDRPLGDWHAVDIVPFIFAYVAIRVVLSFVAFVRKLQEEEKSRRESGHQMK